MATDINRTTSIALPGEVSSEILQKTQESSAVSLWPSRSSCRVWA